MQNILENFRQIKVNTNLDNQDDLQQSIIVEPDPNG